MKHHLNTLYVFTQGAYLRKESETVVVRINKESKVRLPLLNIGSIASRYGGMAGMVAYAASKGALDSFTAGLAREVGHDGIRVNCLRPGTTRTDILGPIGGDEMAARVAANTPLGRLGEPEEIAEAAIWLVSDKASFTHGAFLDVSGGR